MLRWYNLFIDEYGALYMNFNNIDHMEKTASATKDETESVEKHFFDFVFRLICVILIKDIGQETSIQIYRWLATLLYVDW